MRRGAIANCCCTASEIDNLVGKIRDGNLTLVPLSLYFTDGKVKVELALARGKQAHDKRQDMAKRDAEREVTRELGRRVKGMILTGVVCALLSALGYGISDFVGGIASRRVAALRVVMVSYPMALVLLIVIAVIVGGQINQGAVFWGALSGVSQAFGVWWFYAALGSGPISVVSPLTAILVAGIPVGVGLALGERPGPVAVVGVLLALLAVVLVSREATDDDARPHKFTAKVAWLTVGSGVAFGLNFVLIHQAPVEAKLWPLVFARLSASVLVSSSPR